MEVAEFLGLQEIFKKRFDADLMLLADKLADLRQEIFGHKGSAVKTGKLAKGMFEKLQGSVSELIKISSEVLILGGMGKDSRSELMEDIRKEAKSQRLSEKAKKLKNRPSGHKTAEKPHRKPRVHKKG